MESADQSLIENRSQVGWLNPPRNRAVLVQSEMGARSVTVLEVASEHPSRCLSLNWHGSQGRPASSATAASDATPCSGTPTRRIPIAAASTRRTQFRDVLTLGFAHSESAGLWRCGERVYLQRCVLDDLKRAVSRTAV